MDFRLALKSVTLHDVMAIVLCYFAEFVSFRGQLCKSG